MKEIFETKKLKIWHERMKLKNQNFKEKKKRKWENNENDTWKQPKKVEKNYKTCHVWKPFRFRILVNVN
jgi:hypothetical protein